jgi:hypothetical protein
MELNKRSASVEDRHVKCKQFWTLFNELRPWMDHTLALLDEFTAATIYTPTRIDPTVSDRVSHHTQSNLFLRTGTGALDRRASRRIATTHGHL